MWEADHSSCYDTNWGCKEVWIADGDRQWSIKHIGLRIEIT